MTRDLNSTFAGEPSALPIDALLPERPAIIGEFSPAYEAFKAATLADLEPMNNYEFVLALQLVDLHGELDQAAARKDSLQRNQAPLQLRQPFQRRIRLWLHHFAARECHRREQQRGETGAGHTIRRT